MFIYNKKIGDVKAFSASQVLSSRIGIGFEKLDRAVFDPNKAYDKVAAIGVKWTRLQSGWQRTETEKGVYHFEWLDEIVDNLIKRGLIPWICLCYGNRIYDTQAAERFGGVGCPPNKEPEQIKAWHDYVVATVKHFEGRVTWWEIWNEPDCAYSWRRSCNAEEYADFAIATAKAVHEASAKAKVIGGAFAFSHINYVKPCLDRGMADYCDALSFHVYSSNESDDNERIGNLKKMIRLYKPELKLIQGEGGCQSRGDGCGALCGQAWTKEKQAKSLARHMIAQLGADVMFSSCFTSMDMIEALNGKVGDKASYLDFGYFGVIGADFDENGISCGEYTPKPSYRTLQVIASLFRGQFSVEEPIVCSAPVFNKHFACQECYLKELSAYGFRRENGALAYVYWKPGNLLRECYESMTSLIFAGIPAGIPKLIDLIDGSIYEINMEDVVFNPELERSNELKSSCPAKNDGTDRILLRNLPVFDHPLMLDFGGFGD